MKILPANPTHAADIARLIITAMTDDCCRFLVGPGHTLEDFHNTMLRLVLMDDSQYSWRNAFVAVDEEASPDDLEHAPVAGAIVGYDGKDLHRLRRRFQEAAMADWQMDYSNMDDETAEGEFYLARRISPLSQARHCLATAQPLHRTCCQSRTAGCSARRQGQPFCRASVHIVGI